MTSNRSSEMFAFGMSICYFILSGYDYDEWENFCLDFDDKDSSTFETDNDKIFKLNEKALSILEIEKTEQKFIDILGNTVYYELLLEMIHIDPDQRIYHEDLYKECSNELKLKYSLVECYTNLYDNQSLTPELYYFDSIKNNKIMGTITDWMINIKFNLKLKYSLFNAIQIMFRYLKSVKTNITEIPAVATICLLISNIMNNENIIDISKCTKICELKTEIEIINLLNKILTSLNFEVYPETENIEYDKKNEDLWKSVFLEIVEKSFNFKLSKISQTVFEYKYYENKNNKKYI